MKLWYVHARMILTFCISILTERRSFPKKSKNLSSEHFVVDYKNVNDLEKQSCFCTASVAQYCAAAHYVLILVMCCLSVLLIIPYSHLWVAALRTPLGIKGHSQIFYNSSLSPFSGECSINLPPLPPFE